ncbi:MAG: class I SAM-dependent methyltransferase [Bacteroidetes bacterium]|nr:class I SAM-dependent methyltransferase [Bacteroidota bacterium]
MLNKKYIKHLFYQLLSKRTRFIETFQKDKFNWGSLFERSGYASIKEKNHLVSRSILKKILLYKYGATPISPNKLWEYPYVIMNLYPFEDKKILDAGCGKSSVDPFLARRKAHIYGIDPFCSDNIGTTGIGVEGFSYAYPKQYGLKINYKLNSIDKIDYPDEYFDSVICVSVLEHVRYKETNLPRQTKLNNYDRELHLTMLNEMTRVLKPGGKLIITMDYYPPTLGFENNKLIQNLDNSNIDLYYLLNNTNLKLINSSLSDEIIPGSPKFNIKILLENNDIDWVWYANLLQTSIGLIFRK